MRLPAPLLLVSDRRLCTGSMIDALAACIASGARWIWLRERDLPRDERRTLALALRAACGSGLVLSIGADVELADELDEAGVHLPGGGDVGDARRRLGSNRLVGVSAHDFEDVRRARAAGADYATLSPIFPTESKPGYGPALGLDAIARAAATGLPIVALGGVRADNAAACLSAGATAVAVMGGVLAARDPARAARDLANAVSEPRCSTN